ncbi:hypothetical protein VTK56DRAFT_8881 [Thermocarpiscus australiensis]
MLARFEEVGGGSVGTTQAGVGVSGGGGGSAVADGSLSVAKGPRKGLLFPPASANGASAVKGKENQPFGGKSQRTVEPKKAARIGERAMLRGKPVLRDILNDMMDGGY